MTVAGLTTQVQKGPTGGWECTCVHRHTCVHAPVPEVAVTWHRGGWRVTARAPPRCDPHLPLGSLQQQQGVRVSAGAGAALGPRPCLARASAHLGLRIWWGRRQMGAPHGQGPCLLPAVPSTRLAPSEVLEMVTDRLLFRQAVPTCRAYSQLSDAGGIWPESLASSSLGLVLSAYTPSCLCTSPNLA